MAFAAHLLDVEPKDIEKELFKAAPHAAQKLNTAAKKLLRKQKREAWWTENKDLKRKGL
jgi:hypothetical protein